MKTTSRKRAKMTRGQVAKLGNNVPTANQINEELSNLKKEQSKIYQILKKAKSFGTAKEQVVEETLKLRKVQAKIAEVKQQLQGLSIDLMPDAIAPDEPKNDEPAAATTATLSIPDLTTQPTTQVPRNTNLKVYPKHRLNIFPRMNDEDFARLISDIEANGFDPTQSIYLYENAILDGWNRDQACQELGITPRYEDFVGNDMDAINFVLRTNKRRNITSSQWAAIAVESTALITQIQQSVEKARREKQEITKKMSDEERMSVKDLTNMNKNRATSIIAEMVGGTNRQYVHDIRGIKDHDSELFTQVKEGEISIGEAKKKLKNKVVDGSTPKIASQSPYHIDANKKYQILYVRPSFNPSVVNNGDAKILRDLHDLNVPEIAEDNAVLFLHIPPHYEQQAMNLITSWGFKYVESIIALHVENPYPAEYSEQVHDTIMICKKSDGIPAVGKKIRSVFTTEHVLESIDSLFDRSLSRVIIFAEQHNGWDGYDVHPETKQMVLVSQTIEVNSVEQTEELKLDQPATDEKIDEDEVEAFCKGAERAMVEQRVNYEKEKNDRIVKNDALEQVPLKLMNGKNKL